MLSPPHAEKQLEDSTADRNLEILDDLEISPSLLSYDEERDLLGEGSFGVVYKADLLAKGGAKVAVKKLKGEYDDAKVNEFQREVNVMKTLRHPYLCGLIGMYNNPETGELFMVSELAQGSLFDLCVRKKDVELSWLRRTRWCLEILTGISWLHAKKLLHRGMLHAQQNVVTPQPSMLINGVPDLKCENVLLFEDHCKITDFGLTLMQTGSRLLKPKGTLWWRAPELDPEKPTVYDARADIFSFGITVGEIITRQSGLELRMGMMYNTKENARGYANDPELLDDVIKENAEGCPPALVEMFKGCCQEDPDKRPNAKELMSVLHDLHEDLQSLDGLLDDSFGSVAANEDAKSLYRGIVTGTFRSISDCNAQVRDVAAALAVRVSEKTGIPLGKSETEFVVGVIQRNHGDNLVDGRIGVPEFASFWSGYWYPTELAIINPRILPLYKRRFIYGFIGRVDAEKQLNKSRSAGHENVFLVRISSGLPGRLAISYFSSDGKRFRHDTVEVEESGLLWERPKKKTMYPTLHEILRQKVYKRLDVVCPDTPINSIEFTEVEKELDAEFAYSTSVLDSYNMREG